MYRLECSVGLANDCGDACKAEYGSFNYACAGSRNVLIDLYVAVGGCAGGSIAEVGIAAYGCLVCCILGDGGAYLVAQGVIRCGIYPVAVAAAGAGIEVRIAAAGVSNEIPAVVGALDPAAGGGAEGPGASTTLALEAGTYL